MQRIYALARRQRWLYDTQHDSMWPQYRRAAHAVLTLITRAANIRFRFRRPRWSAVQSPVRVNLGSGRSPLSGWINVDLNPFSGAQVWMDLRDTWPFTTAEVDAIYTRHCLEHFTESEILHILGKCRTALGPGKPIRIGVPSLEFAIERYLANDFSFAPWLQGRAESPGGLFFKYIMDGGNHRVTLDGGYLTELLHRAGFHDVRTVAGGVTEYLEPGILADKDNADDIATLYVEARS
jgi:hypothetical protein